MVSNADGKIWKTSRGSLIKTGLGFLAFAIVSGICVSAAIGGNEAAAIVWGSVGAAAAVAAIYCLVLLISSSKQSIQVSPDRIDLTVVKSAWLPVLRRVSLDPKDVGSVDIRQEVFQAPKDPDKPYATRTRTLVEIGSVTTRSGESFNFAYTSSDSLPVPEIAAEIARISGVTVVDHGARRRGVFGVATAVLLPWEGQRVQKSDLHKLPM